MTRATIDFGIDLGTTNSVIAVLVDGQPRIIRNNEQQEITPSVVMIDRNGAIMVGKRAYDWAEKRPQAVAREFKRGMGTDRIFSLHGRTMTPEELSAEVLKVLRASVQANMGEDVRAAVVTVPAMFTLAACEATTRAARLAGIEHALLLQEPIAAGLAYGFQSMQERGYWLVYDLGGGTFDVSLLTLREGRLQVIDHAGDEFLGGKNFDDLLVDYVVEQLQTEYSLPSVVRGADPRYQGLYAKLKQECEAARTRLSQSDNAVVEVNGVFDDEKMPIDTYVNISRETFEDLIAPLVSRTTQIARDLLLRHHLDSEAVQRVIMVGGPTYTPHIRQRVRQDLGIEIETRVDPMTVVAQGAAIYAGQVLREQSASTSISVPQGALRIDLKYSPVSEDTEALIGAKVDTRDRPGLSVEVRRSDGGWASGRIPVTSGTFVAKVILQERRANTFTLHLFDSTGTHLPASPNQFTITHGVAVDDPPLSRSFGVAVDDGTGVPKTKHLLVHGTRLPTQKTHTVRTTRPIGPGQPSGINIHIVEGENVRADRNEHVGYIRLDESNVQRLLSAGADIEITFSMDTSRKLTIKAFVPMLDETFQLELQDTNRPTPDVDVLEQLLRAEEERVEHISQVTSVRQAPVLVNGVQRALDEARSGDADAAFRAQRQLRELQAVVDSAADTADLPLLTKEWQELLPKTHQVLTDYGEPSSRQQLVLLEREGNEALAARDQTRLRQRLEQLQHLYWSTLMAQPGWWVGFYQYLVERQHEMLNPSTARVLIQEGRRALERQDFDALRQTCWRLWELLGMTQTDTGTGLPDVNIRA